MKLTKCSGMATAILPVLEALCGKIANAAPRVFKDANGRELRTPGYARWNTSPGLYVRLWGLKEQAPQWNDPEHGVWFRPAADWGEDSLKKDFREKHPELEGKKLFYGYASNRTSFEYETTYGEKGTGECPVQFFLVVEATNPKEAAAKAEQLAQSVVGKLRSEAADAHRQAALQDLQNAIRHAWKNGLSDEDIVQCIDIAKVQEVMVS